VEGEKVEGKGMGGEREGRGKGGGRKWEGVFGPPNVQDRLTPLKYSIKSLDVSVSVVPSKTFAEAVMYVY